MATWPDMVDVWLTDEQGNALDTLCSGPTDGRELIRSLPRVDDVRYAYLRFIDWADTTTFTRLQMNALIPEIRRLSEERPSPVIDRLLLMAERCERTTHSRLVFHGV